jgi:hypothetical protein
MEKGAVISECGTYRYKLWRIWDESLPMVLFIMHNPSTADADLDDPTIRRCINFAKDWGYGGMYVGNVSPYRSTNPEVIRTGKWCIVYPDENLSHVHEMMVKCRLYVLACGNPPSLMVLEDIMNITGGSGWYCIRKTKHGFPGHPLYLPKILTPIPFDFP